MHKIEHGRGLRSETSSGPGSTMTGPGLETRKPEMANFCPIVCGSVVVRAPVMDKDLRIMIILCLLARYLNILTSFHATLRMLRDVQSQALEFCFIS